MQNKFWSRLRNFKSNRKHLDQILEHVPEPECKIKVRTSWFIDLLEWIRREGLFRNSENFETGATQAKRVEYFLTILDRNLVWKRNVAKTLRSIMRDTHGLELFLETGVSSQDSFTSEFINRLQNKILPIAPEEDELAYIFTENFKNQRDLEWIKQLDAETFEKIIQLFNFEYDPAEKAWNNLKFDAKEALALISIQMQGLGLSPQIRQRIAEKDYRKMSFYVLGRYVERYLVEEDSLVRSVIGTQIDKKIEDCFHTLAEVQQHLDDFGVSIQIVFQIEKLETLLNRIRYLIFILQQKAMDPSSLSTFIEILVRDSFERRSLLSLASQSFSLLARKIVERTAETGEHYITRTLVEYKKMINRAWGGGVITAFTILIKFLLYFVGATGFFGGIFASINYSISFLVIHFLHFTLATKQSSVTAPVLAAKMHGIRNRSSLDSLIDEIVNTIRTQVAAVFGNMTAVIPVILIICWVTQSFFNKNLLSEEKAHHVIHSFSILGPTPLYAAFTGILLWISSLIAGWVDNWYAYHRLSPALAQNRRLVFVFGEKQMRLFSIFMKNNIVGIAGNISLAFLLGLTPVILQFLGIHLDVRHVTLSTGSLAAAAFYLNSHFIETWDFWFAVFGVLSMGILNLSVSFAMALFLAIRARRIEAPERELIYKSLIDRLRYQPFSFLWPQIKS
jgi:site-specific recombinase